MRDVTGKDIPEQSKMERRVRRKAPARCGSGEKAEVISSEPYLSTYQFKDNNRIIVHYNIGDYIQILRICREALDAENCPFWMRAGLGS